MPQRIQRSRKKGSVMPEDAIYVGRPTKYGNPFRVQMPMVDSPESILVLFEEHLDKVLAVEPDFLEPLRGKDLACWCRPTYPCHADVLLKRANANSNGDQ